MITAQENFPIFEIADTCYDVFIKLEYVKNETMSLGDLLNSFKKDVLGQNDENFVAIYARRLGSSYEVIGRFITLPIFPPHITSKLLVTVLKYKDLTELNHQQLYTITDNGAPILAHTSSQYGIGYYFNQRKAKYGNVPILNVYNPNEHVVNLDFAFSTGLFATEEESIAGETFYICDEWSHDVRITIGEEAEIAFSEADEIDEIKDFRAFTMNDIVLVKGSGNVRRGCVLTCVNNVCEVLLVDYGVKLRCSTDKLRIAPPDLVYIKFLAIPCVLKEIGAFATNEVRKVVNEMIRKLEKDQAELVVMKKDMKSMQHVDIIFEDTYGEKVSIADHLKESGLIQSAKSTQMDCIYGFSELLKLVGNARKVALDEAASPIKRSFLPPSEFLAKSTLAKKFGIRN